MKNLPAELMERITLTNSHGMPTYPYELDEDLMDWDRSHVRFIDEATDDRGNKFHLVRYTATDGINRLCALYCEPEITAEDLAEWISASVGEC